MQVTNQYAQVGLKNVQKAVKLGIMTLANCKTAENYGWNASVPTNWQVSENSDAKNSYKKVNDFWNASSTGAVGWKAVVIAPANAKLEDVTVNEGVKLSDVIAEMDTFNKNYLSVWANSINCTPDWLVKLQQGK
jgi:hypothetical protein